MVSLISTGDIVEYLAPTFLIPGKPGHLWRKALVLGLEVDPHRNSMEGLWLCRLSSRPEKIRPWDHLISGDDIAGQDGLLTEGEWVVRTHRIDLIPATQNFFGPKPNILGHATPETLVFLRDKFDHGQTSHLYTGSLGPRAKLPHTVVKMALASENSYDYFDYDVLLTEARHSPVPLSSRGQEYTLAERDKNLQQSELGLSIQAAFASQQGPGATEDRIGPKKPSILLDLT